MTAAPGPAPEPPVLQKREFWVLLGHAVALGVFGAFAALASWPPVGRPGPRQ